MTKNLKSDLYSKHSGKLITLISSDIFQVERAFAYCPIVLAAPIISTLVFVLIGYQFGWWYALVTLVCWFVSLCGTIFGSIIQKKYKTAEAHCNDERMKLVNDLISGIRTIKSYAWENHYL